MRAGNNKGMDIKGGGKWARGTGTGTRSSKQIDKHPLAMHTHSTWRPEDREGNRKHTYSAMCCCHVSSDKCKGQREVCEGCVEHSELELEVELVPLPGLFCGPGTITSEPRVTDGSPTPHTTPSPLRKCTALYPTLSNNGAGMADVPRTDTQSCKH